MNDAIEARTPDISVEIAEFSPVTSVARGFLHCLKWLSLIQWLSRKRPHLRSRGELSQAEAGSITFTKKRARAIEGYICCWWVVEVAMLIWWWLGVPARIVAVLAAALLASRALEIIQVTTNAAIFDSLSGRPDERVASRARMVVLAGANYLELGLCFGALYAADIVNLKPATEPIGAYYFAFITQMTIGYGDIAPVGWLRLVVVVHGLMGVLFVILVFGRFIASLPAIQSVFDAPRRA